MFPDSNPLDRDVRLIQKERADLMPGSEGGDGDHDGRMRPWGLRGLVPTPGVTLSAYRYDPDRQIAVTSAGDPWLFAAEGSNHSSIAELDGDEGRSESWGEDAGKDVTEGA